jgi:hypothetical protein
MAGSVEKGKTGHDDVSRGVAPRFEGLSEKSATSPLEAAKPSCSAVGESTRLASALNGVDGGTGQLCGSCMLAHCSILDQRRCDCVADVVLPHMSSHIMTRRSSSPL